MPNSYDLHTLSTFRREITKLNYVISNTSDSNELARYESVRSYMQSIVERIESTL